MATKRASGVQHRERENGAGMTIAASKSKKEKTGGEGGLNFSDPAMMEKGGGGQHHDYGIRSHLHEFYDWRGGSLVMNEAGGNDGWYLLGGSSPSLITRRRLVYTFRILTILGLLLLVLGAVLILVGYMWPKDPLPILERASTIETGDGKIYAIRGELSDLAELLQEKMTSWKMTGLIIFACGGTLLAVSLLVPMCARLLGREGFTSDLNTPVEPPVKIFAAPPPPFAAPPPVTGSDWKKSGGGPPSPTDRLVPVVEEIAKVQPKSQSTDTKRRTSGDELLLMEEDQPKHP